MQTWEISIWRKPKQAGSVLLLLRTAYLTKLIERAKILIEPTQPLVDQALDIILIPSLLKHIVLKSPEKPTELFLNKQNVENLILLTKPRLITVLNLLVA